MKKTIFTFLGVAILSASTQAQTTWNTVAGGDWDTDSNWDPAAFPNTEGADARITNLATAGAYDITASSALTFSIGRLDFGTNSAAVDLDMSLNSNAGLIFDVASGNAQFNLATGGSGSTMIINSAIQLNDNTTVSLTRNGSTQIIPIFAGAINLQGNDLTFGTSRAAGIKITNAISGAGKLVFSGPGSDRATFFTNSTSTFSGGIDLNAAGNVIQLGNEAAGTNFTSSGSAGILGTGTINFNSASNSTSNPRSPLILSNGAFFSNDSTDTTTNLLVNTLSIAVGRFGVIDTPRPLNFSGSLTGAGKLYKTSGSSTGMRQWAINTANTGFAGVIELRDGQLQTRVTDAIGAGATISFNPTSSANGVALQGCMANGASVTIGSTLDFQRNATGIHQYISTSGGSTFELTGNFSNSGTGTVGYIGFGRGNGTLTTSGGGFAVGTNTGTARIILSGTGTLENPIGIVDGSSTISVLRFANTSGTQTFTGTFTGNGDIERDGSGGTTVLSGTNSYSGTTKVSNGTLRVDGSHTGGGAYTVDATGILAGSGSIGSATTVYGGLAPGSSVGTLTFDSSLSLGDLPVGALRFGLGSPGTAGTDYDTLSAGSLNIGSGTLDFADFQFTNAGGLAAGIYTLFTSTNAITGTPGGTLTGTVGAFSGTIQINTNTIVLTLVASGGGYNSWASTNGVTGGVNGDSDNDGVINGMEYALQTNLTGSDGSLGNYTGGTLSFTKRQDAIDNGDVTYIIETSGTLATGSWTAQVTHAPGNTDATINCVLPTGQGRIFARLRVEIAP